MFNRITLYGLVTTESPKIYLTIVARKQQAIEYAKRLLLLDHQSHFTQWCSYRNLACTDLNAANQYFRDCITDSEKKSFKVVKIKLNNQGIATSLRMFSGNIPLGCSYESPIEYEYITDQINKNKFDDDTLNLLQSAAEINPRIFLHTSETDTSTRR